MIKRGEEPSCQTRLQRGEDEWSEKSGVAHSGARQLSLG